jgi:CDP-paratose synthetase
MANLMITGASGFLGSALAMHFAGSGHEVTLLVRPNSSMHRLGSNASEFRTIRVDGDSSLADAVSYSAPDVLIHTACSYGRKDETPLAIFDANLRLGLLLLLSAAKLDHPVTFINTGTVMERDVSDYALSKAQFSEWGRRLAKHSLGHLKFINVLLQHMYGPGDDATKFSTRIIQSCLENDPHIPMTPGAQRRDFIYIEDVVLAYDTLVRQASAWQEESVDVEIGSGKAPTLREFVELVHKLTGSAAVLGFGAIPYRSNEGMHYQADLTRMRSIGWSPRISLVDGLRRVIQAERDALESIQNTSNPSKA